MRPTLLPLLAVLACSPAPDAGPAIPPFDADAAMGEWVALWAGYDLDGLDQLFVRDSSLTYLSSERPGLIRGPDALRQHHAGMGFVAGGQPPAGALWVDEVESTVHGTTAVVTAVWYFGDREQPDSVQRGPMTAVYVWAGDRYRIAHMHFANY